MKNAFADVIEKKSDPPSLPLSVAIVFITHPLVCDILDDARGVYYSILSIAKLQCG